MDTIQFDAGIRTYRVNDTGVLKFNPSDPNVYKRLKDLTDRIEKTHKEVAERTKGLTDGLEAVELLAQYDQSVKKELSKAFGETNDFDKIFGGVNLMAITANGEMVVSNFLNAIFPILEDGIRAYAKAEAWKAVQEAQIHS